MIRNTKIVIGLVTFVGKDSKLMKNTQSRIFKISTVEKLMNKYIFIVIMIFSLLLLILSLIQTFDLNSSSFDDEVLEFEENRFQKFFYTFLGYMLLMNTILPISIIITL